MTNALSQKTDVLTVLYKLIETTLDQADDQTDEIEAAIGWTVSQVLLIVLQTIHNIKEEAAAGKMERISDAAIVFDFLEQFTDQLKATPNLSTKWHLINIVDHLVLVLSQIKIEPEFRQHIATETARLIRAMEPNDPGRVGRELYDHAKEIEAEIAERLIILP